MGSSVNRSLQAKNNKARRSASAFGFDRGLAQAIDKAYYKLGVAAKDYTVADADIVVLTDANSIATRYRRHF